MHELAIVEDIVQAVTARTSGRRVVRVRVRVGSLVAVVPDAMLFCFDVAAADTALEGAVLEIESITARARCAACHAEFELRDGIALCPSAACGSADVTILAGQELVIQDVEVR